MSALSAVSEPTVMNRCCLCGGAEFRELFNLGPLPLGFPVEAGQLGAGRVWTQDLALAQCTRCLLGQTRHKVPADKLAAENLYLSASSKIISDHDNRFASAVPVSLSLSKDALVMEIGSGDGSLLERFRRAGFRNLLGVEPSPHPGKEYPFEVIVDFFGPRVVDRLTRSGRRPDLVIANYVIELVPDLDGFFRNLAAVMGDGAFAILEVPYLNDFMRAFRLDGFAHLRCNWFTLTSFAHAFERAGIEMVGIEHEANYRGGTLRVTGRKGQRAGKGPPAELAQWMNRETEEFQPHALAAFRARLDEHRSRALASIRELAGAGTPIFGYGGGLKASTLVNWLGLTARDLRMTVDNDPNKQGRFVPVADIPIRPVGDLLATSPAKVGVVILALDHVEEVEGLLRKGLGKGSTIVHLLPDVRTVTVA